MIPHPPTVVIEKLTPLIDGGRYPIKRTVGEDTVVEADIFKDGHDVVSAVLKWRKVAFSAASATAWLATGASAGDSENLFRVAGDDVGL